MVRLVSGLLVVLACFFYSPSKADTSQNLIDNNNWNGATYGYDPGGCCASVSGSGALYDYGTNTILYSYGTDVLWQTIAINDALKASGIEVSGFNYGWSFKKVTNNGRDGDTLQFDIQMTDSNGNAVENYSYNYSDPSYAHEQWYTVSGSETFVNSYIDPQDITLRIIGKDGGFWAGYYGPEVKDVSLSLNYTSNPCANPLSDPSCEGYAEAYYNQQCSFDPLYDQGCNGYEQAYYTQQCSFDALYDTGCPGYEEAYYNQQCSFDALYDTGCPGYEEAYYNQQCSLDALYDTGCPGYEEAYYNYQCGLDSLYDQGCDGYALAFEEQQCSLNPQYSPTCLGYQFETITIVEEPIVVVEEQQMMSEPVEQIYTEEIVEEDYVEVIEPLTKEKEKDDGESKSSDNATNESDNKPESRKRESALRLGLGVSDRLVAGLVSSSISSGDASAEESQAMNTMLQSDNEAFSQLTQSSSTSTKDDNNSAAGVGPIVVVIIPPESSGGEPTEKQESLAERIAEKVRQANLEKSATYKGQTAMLENMNNAVDLTAYDQVLTDRDEIYVMSQIYPDNVMETNNANHYRMRRQNYGVYQQLIRSQY